MPKCAYCGQERPNEELKQGTIITRGRKWDEWKRRNVACFTRETNLYCKDKGCQGYDQMAHEG